MITFVQWLQGTPISLGVRQISWLIPLMQTLHILANGLVLSAIIMLDLRVWGRSRAEPVAERARRMLHWLWAAMGLLTTTGLVLILGTPRRTLLDKTFQVKMLILAAAIAATVALALMLRRATPDGASAGRMAGTLAAATLLLWLSVTLAGRGRWIGNFIG